MSRPDKYCVWCYESVFRQEPPEQTLKPHVRSEGDQFMCFECIDELEEMKRSALASLDTTDPSARSLTSRLREKVEE